MQEENITEELLTEGDIIRLVQIDSEVSNEDQDSETDSEEGPHPNWPYSLSEANLVCEHSLQLLRAMMASHSRATVLCLPLLGTSS